MRAHLDVLAQSAIQAAPTCRPLTMRTCLGSTSVTGVSLRDPGPTACGSSSMRQPRDRGPLSRGIGGNQTATTRMGETLERESVLRRRHVLEPLALPPPATRPRAEASTEDRPPRVAGGDHRGPSPGVRARTHSQRWLPDRCERGVKSVRYHFSNKSEDIKALYCESLDALGVRWTRPCDRQVAVYRKSSVAILDDFIGPKR